MNIFKILFFFKKNVESKKESKQEGFDKYEEIAKLIKEARIHQNLTIQDLSRISKIQEQTINYIENNDKKFIPKYPFIRSILIKLEECLGLKKNTLVNLASRKEDTFKKEKKEFIVSKFDIINTWQGTLLYFFMLILIIFLIKKYFILNVKIIEIQNIENKIIEK